MTGFGYLIYFIPLTAIFLIVCGGSLLYFSMGIGQLATGYREKDKKKKRAGWITAFVTLAIIAASTYYYLHLTFLS